MLFFPYIVDLRLRRFPYLTLAVCLLCLFVHIEQHHSNTEYVDAINEYCEEPPLDRMTLVVLRNISGTEDDYPCWELYLEIRNADDAAVKIDELIDEAQPLNLFRDGQIERDYMTGILTVEYEKFDQAIPHDLTDELVYEPDNMRLWNMVTAVFSHGDPQHLGGNLLFFFAFAASVEAIVGSIAFISVILATAVTTGLAYSYSVAGTEAAVPTLGLSGVVSGMITLLAVLVPKVKIRCFIWFFVIFNVIKLPALLLAAWFIGWDVYYLMTYGSETQTNFVAHVSGGATGALIGGLYWWFRGDYIRGLNG